MQYAVQYSVRCAEYTDIDVGNATVMNAKLENYNKYETCSRLAMINWSSIPIRI